MGKINMEKIQMKQILIIEDNNLKFEHISFALKELLDNPTIVWKKSRNAGLLSILNHNVRKNKKEYDIIICDNYLPIYDESREIEPFALDIAREIRERFKLEVPLIICSSDFHNNGDFYTMCYDSSIDIRTTLKEIIENIKEPL